MVVVATAFAACGSDQEGEPIPRDVVSAIDIQLDQIRGQIDNGSLGACEDIKQPENTFEVLQAAVDAVPRDVDADVRDALVQSVDRLSELVDERCASLEDAEAEAEAETETAPEDTETIEIPTVPEEETPPTETVPDEEEENGELPPGQEKKLEEPDVIPPDEGSGNSGGGAPAPGDDGG